MGVEVKPDIEYVPSTQEEADKANKLYNFVVREKDKTHRDNERRTGVKIKKKKYTPNRFLKDMLLASLDDVDGGN